VDERVIGVSSERSQMGDKRAVHLIVDLYECNLSHLPESGEAMEALRKLISDVLAEHSLTEVGSTYHFLAPRAVTATVCFPESHLAFHSSPDEGYVGLDLFVGTEHTKKAERVIELLAHEIFCSSDVRRLVVPR